MFTAVQQLLKNSKWHQFETGEMSNPSNLSKCQQLVIVQIYPRHKAVDFLRLAPGSSVGAGEAALAGPLNPQAQVPPAGSSEQL